MDLSDHEAKLFAEAVIDTMREALIVLDETMHVVSANRTFYEKFQVSRAETEGAIVYDLGNGQWNIPELKNLLEDIIPANKSFEGYQVRHRFDAIGEKMMVLNAKKLKLPDSKSDLILLAIEDVTAELNALGKSVESEEKYKKLVEEINSFIIRIDKQKRITFFNAFCEKTFGYKRDEILGTSFIGKIIPCVDSRGTNNTHFCDDLFTKPQKHYTNESEGVCKDGSRIWFSWSAKALYDKNGEFEEILIDGNDITELVLSRGNLEDKSAMLDALLDFIPEGIMITDNDHKIKAVSQYMGDLFGVDAKSLIGTNEPDRYNLLELYFLNGQRISRPDELPLSKAITTKQRYTDYQLLLKRDGTTNVLSANAAPIIDKNGHVLGAIGAWRDITEQKEYERQLRESELRFRSIFDNAAIGIVVVDKNDHFVAVNDHICKLLGYTKEEILSLNVNQLTSMEDRKKSAEINTMVHQGITNKYSYEKRYLKKDGTTLWVNVTVSGLRDAQNNHIGSIGTVEDISERKKVELELVKTAQQKELALSAASMGLWHYNPLTKVTSWDDRCREIFGCNNNDTITNELFRQCIHPDDLIHFSNEIDLSLNPIDSKPLVAQYRIVRQDKKIRWIEAHGTALFEGEGENKRVIGLVGTIADITEKKELEEKLQIERNLLQTIIDSIPVMITLYDPDLQKIEVNNAFEHITGWTQEDATNQNLMELVYPDPILRQDAEQYMQSLTPGFKDLLMEAKDGSKIESSWANVRIPDGRQVGIGIDISKVRRAEREVQETAERFRRITSSHIIGCAIATSEGSLTFVNDHYLDIIGYSREEFERANINWKDITPPEHLERDMHAIDELRRAGYATPYEKQFIKKDGSRVWVILADTLLPGPEELIFGFVLDITERKLVLEEELKRRAEIEAILDSLPDGYILYNSDGTIRRMNDLAREVLSFESEDASIPYSERMKKLRIVNPDGALFQTNELPSAKALQGKVTRNIVMKIEKSDRDYWLSVSASPIKTNERVVGAIMEFSDVTELRALQEQLADERNFVNAVLQVSGALITVIDKKGMIVRFNKACEKLTGYSAEEVLNKSVFDLLLPQDERSGAEEVTDRLLHGEKLIEHENHWLTKYGSKRFIRWRNTSLFDNTGKPEFAVATGIDISDRKKTEEALRESEERYRFVNRATHDIIWDWDLITNHLEWNEAVENVIQKSRIEINPTIQAWQEHIHPEDSLRVVQSMHKAIDEGETVWSTEYRFGPKGGPYRVFLDRGIIARSNEGKAYRMIGSMLDITDRIKAEKELQDRTKELAAAYNNMESFAYSVSHDLRNPLTVIRAMSGFLKEDYAENLDVEGMEYVTKIIVSAAKAQQLIDDILKLSRIDRQEIKREKIDLSAMVSAILEELHSSEKQRTAEFIIKQGINVYADPRLTQVALENLLRNAWKFTSKNDVTRIDFGVENKSGKNVFYIRDNGAGFDKKFAQAIFEPFKRVHAEREFSGTGIGLSIVHRVINRHGGSIWAEGEAGKGAVFYFTLD